MYLREPSDALWKLEQCYYYTHSLLLTHFEYLVYIAWRLFNIGKPNNQSGVYNFSLVSVYWVGNVRLPIFYSAWLLVILFLFKISF